MSSLAFARFPSAARFHAVGPSCQPIRYAPGAPSACGHDRAARNEAKEEISFRFTLSIGRAFERRVNAHSLPLKRETFSGELPSSGPDVRSIRNDPAKRKRHVNDSLAGLGEKSEKLLLIQSASNGFDVPAGNGRIKNRSIARLSAFLIVFARACAVSSNTGKNHAALALKDSIPREGSNRRRNKAGGISAIASSQPLNSGALPFRLAFFNKSGRRLHRSAPDLRRPR